MSHHRIFLATASLTLAGLILNACGSGPAGMTLVAANATLGTGAFFIDTYETSVFTVKGNPQPDGTLIDVETAQSAANQTPKTGLSYSTAKALCEAVGKRICTFEEWGAACRGASNLRFSFQSAFDEPQLISENCIVGRVDANGEPLSTAETPLPNLTGVKPFCRTRGLAAFDMVANVSEWVSVTDTDGSKVGEVFTGGVPVGPNYTTSNQESSCDFILTIDVDNDGKNDSLFPQTSQSSTVGFRCCKDST